MIPVSKIKYLAFEGGGGKGVAYLGAIEALEEKGVLPISNNNRHVLGVSGSSTGAINALMLSLHMSSTEIENELKNKNFEEFYTKDDPNNAIFRAVYTPREKSNNPLRPGGFKNKNQIIVGYAIDSIKEEITEAYKKSKKKEDLNRFIFPADNLFSELNEAQKQSTIIVNKNNSLLSEKITLLRPLGINLGLSPNKAISKIHNAVIKSEKIKNSDDGMLKQLLSNSTQFPKYVYNILYDRGVFPGFDPREYFSSLITRIMKEKFDYEIDGSLLSFQEFFEITEVDIRISGANISNQIPVYFSKNDTPDFPVAEAIGMAMSMPLIFKPVYVDAVVDKTKNEDYQKKYRGFYVDAGSIRNFPLHAFDDEGINPDVLNENVLGFQLTGGAESITEFDNSMKLKITDEELNNLYKEYEKAYREKYSYIDEKKVLQVKELDYDKIYPFQFGNINKFKVDNIVGTSLIEFASKLLDSVMYYTEEGQIRSDIEREQVINLYTYHIFTRDFNPHEKLREFVRKRAFNKTQKLLI